MQSRKLYEALFWTDLEVLLLDPETMNLPHKSALKFCKKNVHFYLLHLLVMFQLSVSKVFDANTQKASCLLLHVAQAWHSKRQGAAKNFI